MALFGRKNKREGTAACCGGNCNEESMAKAEQAKKRGQALKYWEAAAQNAISLKPLQKRH